MKRYTINTGLVIANELIALSEKAGIRKISGEQNLEYEKSLYKCAEDKDISLIILPEYDTDGIEGLVNDNDSNNHKFMEFQSIAGDFFVKIKDGVSTQDLRRNYRASLPYDVLKLFLATEEDLISITSNTEHETTM